MSIDPLWFIVGLLMWITFLLSALSNFSNHYLQLLKADLNSLYDLVAQLKPAIDEVSQDVKNIGFSTPFIELHSRVLNIEKLLTDSKRDEA